MAQVCQEDNCSVGSVKEGKEPTHKVYTTGPSPFYLPMTEVLCAWRLHNPRNLRRRAGARPPQGGSFRPPPGSRSRSHSQHRHRGGSDACFVECVSCLVRQRVKL